MRPTSITASAAAYFVSNSIGVAVANDHAMAAAMSCELLLRVAPCHAMPCHGSTCHAIFWHAVPCHILHPYSLVRFLKKIFTHIWSESDPKSGPNLTRGHDPSFVILSNVVISVVNLLRICRESVVNLSWACPRCQQLKNSIYEKYGIWSEMGPYGSV